LLKGHGAGETQWITEALIPLLPEQQGMLNKVLHAIVGADGASQVGCNFGETPFSWAPANSDSGLDEA
jgi:hypothetical protein